VTISRLYGLALLFRGVQTIIAGTFVQPGHAKTNLQLPGQVGAILFANEKDQMC